MSVTAQTVSAEVQALLKYRQCIQELSVVFLLSRCSHPLSLFPSPDASAGPAAKRYHESLLLQVSAVYLYQDGFAKIANF